MNRLVRCSHRAMEIWLWYCIFGKYQKQRLRHASHRFRCLCSDDIWVNAVCARDAIIIAVVLLYCIRETRRTPYGHSHTSRKWKAETKAQRTATKYVLKTEPLWNIRSSAGTQPASQPKKRTKFGCRRRVEGAILFVSARAKSSPSTNDNDSASLCSRVRHTLQAKENARI